jgi:DNA polymerase elongation subunit (family B)
MIYMNKLEFQIYDWMEDHELDTDNDSDESDNIKNSQHYIIHTFGRMIDGKSVYMRIINFTPHFYIRLPLTWSKVEAKSKVATMFRYLTSDLNKKVWAKFRPCLLSMDIVERMAAEGFTNEKQFLFARLVFNNNVAMNKYRFLFEESELSIPSVTTRPTSFKTYEANISPMLRCFHIRKISGCSWVEVNKYNMIEGDSKESYCQVEIRVDWREVNPIVKTQNAPLRIMSFDLECLSTDGGFPQARRAGDKILQIGSTYTYLGESTPYRQHIVCLNETDPLDNIIVESYNDERDLVKGWIDEIIKSDCDIITGYNIFFFDEPYIYERCLDHLNIIHEISKISKLKNFNCNFRDFKLASSALGENRIRMFNTPGRIHIDLMKDVQKNHKLPRYRLDDVASSFIRDIIFDIKMIDNTIVLKCNGIKDIGVGDYIHIEQSYDYISENIGKKYYIKSVDSENKLLTIETTKEINEFIESTEYQEWSTQNKSDRKFKLWWCQAKDDIDVKDIFKSYKGTPADRAIIAKYCVKDCKLVNLLMDKLNIVTNNIEMSNVCYVPMSFLFTRGQTIKLFSLVLKEYRECGYLFPVLKKPDEKTPSYEGAIVFEPEPTVEYEALAVNDYASLYPSSIIEMNMSHETKVRLDKYDNMEDTKYYNANFRDFDGSIQHRRFAQKEKMGVIPTILTNLLKERLIVKKQLKTEKNYFTAKILDGKQLALKVTANSLYGALGADTSPILDRDIAACTTSIGRERLILAKNFVENIVPGFFNGLKYAWLKGNESVANQLISMEVNSRDEKLIERLKKFITHSIKDYTFQPIVRYGDSVIGTTPLLLRNTTTGNITIDSINNLSQDYFLMDRPNALEQLKESAEINNLESWTESGWTKIHRVIRHRLHKDKKLYRITTHSGSVVVTDDHSLLSNDGKITSPKNIKIGDKLLHSFPTINNNKSYTFYNGVVLNEEIAQFLGMFLVNGSCEFDRCSLWCSDENIIKKYQNICNKYFTDFDWIINSSDTLTPSKEHNDITKCLREIYKNNSVKIVPECILNASRDIRKSFLHGYYDANSINFSQNKKGNGCSALGIYTLSKSLGYEVSINSIKEKLNIKIKKEPFIDCDQSSITNIQLYKTSEEYVYDLTTENHHFQAGVGSLIVHNTDSIFTCYRFRENVKRIKDGDSLKLWKEIIKFAHKLIVQFIPNEYRDIWNTLYLKYYDDNMITTLSLPKGPDYVEPPSHYKNVPPVEERLEQFLLKYMEEGFLSWLWILQDIFTKQYIDITVKENMIESKLFKAGQQMIERIKLVPEELTDEVKYSIVTFVKTFITTKLREYIIQPYWDIENDRKITRIYLYKNGVKIIDKRCLELTIEMGILAGEFIKTHLPFPHDCKYEKTFWPFLILTKKRYVGNKYEEDPDKYKQDYNGIVLKRRDNAPIVKEICGGIINRLINEKDPIQAKEFTIDCMRKMFNSEYNIKYFLTSKTLKMKESYVDWTKIAHCVLAERIAIRTPGNSPQSGDRIEFAAVVVPDLKKNALQGERIETPEYISTNNLKLDYEFYMTNQIMNPSLQFLSLVIPNAKSIFDEFKLKIENEKAGRTNILDFCIKK